jgi:catechol 2,3-dioxygenase-like lactoylglutathione lyase family enzyme
MRGSDRTISMFTKLMYTTLFVKDRTAALEFYTNILGFEKRAD